MTELPAPGFWEPKQVRYPERGLFSVVEVHEGVDPYLLLGAQYETTRCTTGGYWDALCAEPEMEKTFGGTYNIVGKGAAVYDGVECAPVGTNFDEIQSRLRDSLRSKAEFAVERLLSEGIDPGTPLNSATIVELLAEAENLLAAQYSGRGVLHMGRVAATLAKANNLLIEPADNSDVVHTITGVPVALGRGYGFGANLAIGVTGHVSVLLGPILPVTTLPNRDNIVVTMLEQQFVVLVECLNTMVSVV